MTIRRLFYSLIVSCRYKQNVERAHQIEEWHTDGGVLILGYDMFRNLSSETNRARKKQKDAFQRGLINPGADLVVCDEGHLLKNSKTSLSKAVNRIRTLRRIVLTGTPLQNNLNECKCPSHFGPSMINSSFTKSKFSLFLISFLSIQIIVWCSL